jgi:type VI secretion system protein ImpH
VAPTQRNPEPHLELQGIFDADSITGIELRRHGFFGLVALLERMTPEAERVGGANPSREVIRFKHDPSLSFSSQDVSGVSSASASGEEQAGRHVFEVTTTFLGLIGGASPTPAYISEEVLRQEGRSLRDFLDLFHHRLISLLYRELARFKPWAEQTSAVTDSWSTRLFSLAGLDAYSAPLGSYLPPQKILKLLPLLARRIRPSQSLARGIAEVLDDVIEGAPVRIKEFAGGWSAVPQTEQTQLGVRNTELGQNALLGEQVSDPAGGFEVHVGSLGRRAFRQLADPDGPLRRVHSLISLWVRDPLEYRVVVSLVPDAVPLMRLGEDGGRLGSDSWLGRPSHDTRVTVYPSIGMHTGW